MTVKTTQQLSLDDWVVKSEAEPKLNPSKPHPVITVSLADAQRFWGHVKKGDPDECWPWNGANVRGYGVFTVGKYKKHRANRVAWFLHNNSQPDKYVLHKCDNPSCCNPNHLFLGTQRENMHDMIAKGRKQQARGTQISLAKMDENKVIQMRAKYQKGKRGCGMRVLAREFNVTPGTVFCILKRITWTHI